MSQRVYLSLSTTLTELTNGEVGLCLSIASHIFLSSFWNPSAAELSHIALSSLAFVRLLSMIEIVSTAFM